MRDWITNGVGAIGIFAVAAGGGFYIGKKTNSVNNAVAVNSAATAPTDPQNLGSINGIGVSKSDLNGGERFKIYEAETQVHTAYTRILEERWMNNFFDTYMGEKKLPTRTAAQESYIRENVNITEERVSQIVEQFKNNEQLKNLSPEQQKVEVRRALEAQEGQAIMRQLIANARATSALSVSYPEPSEPAFEVADGGNPFLGAANAKVTIVEFADYQCPFCARMVAPLTDLVKKYEGKVRWVYRDWPLNFHPQAIPAAWAANCAGAQGKYFEAHNFLYENHATLSEDLYTKMVNTLQLDKSKYDECRKDENQRKELMADFEAGEKIGVNGTPAYFINGRRMKVGAGIDAFSKTIEEELAKP